MAEQVLINCKLFLDEFNMSGSMNALALNFQSEIQEKTVFGDSNRTFLGGVKMGDWAHEGIWDSDGVGKPDDVIFDRVGSPVVMTVAPVAGLTGETAYFNRAILGSYNPVGEHGDVFSFSVGGEFKEQFIGGTILHNATEVATGNSVARQVGAVSSTQKIYGLLHVLAASGTSPTLDVIVQSDTDSGMGTPITRLTFAQKVAVGSEFISAAVASADEWWRATFTIGGGGPSFTFILTIGIT